MEILKRAVLGIILAISLLAPFCVRMAMVVDFSINRDAIAAQRCVYRNTPMTMCGGSCYLNMQLQKTNSDPDQQVEEQLITDMLFHFRPASLITISIPYVWICALPVCPQSAILIDGIIQCLFRPPRYSE